MGVWEGAEHTDNKSDVGIWNNLLYEYAGEKAWAKGVHPNRIVSKPWVGILNCKVLQHTRPLIVIEIGNVGHRNLIFFPTS